MTFEDTVERVVCVCMYEHGLWYREHELVAR